MTCYFVLPTPPQISTALFLLHYGNKEYFKNLSPLFLLLDICISQQRQND